MFIYIYFSSGAWPDLKIYDLNQSSCNGVCNPIVAAHLTVMCFSSEDQGGRGHCGCVIITLFPKFHKTFSY